MKTYKTDDEFIRAAFKERCGLDVAAIDLEDAKGPGNSGVGCEAKIGTVTFTDGTEQKVFLKYCLKGSVPF